MQNLALALLAAVAFIVRPAHAIGETVALPSGNLQGMSVMSGTVVQFLGVPFAQPPVGDLRWRGPLQEKPWRGTLQAQQIKPACMQHNESSWYPQPVSEDW